MEKNEQWNGHSIRFVEHNGEWWAVLADIAKVLELEQRFINETIFSSRKSEAKAFKLWVFETIRQLRQVTGLEGFEVFRMLDKEHQKQAMARLSEGLEQVSSKDLIKANTIANKAVSNKYGLPKMVGKSQMTEPMLKDREPLLEDTVELQYLRHYL